MQGYCITYNMCCQQKTQKNISNKSSEKSINEILNNSEKIQGKERIISNLESLQSIHNLTIQENEKFFWSRPIKTPLLIPYLVKGYFKLSG